MRTGWLVLVGCAVVCVGSVAGLLATEPRGLWFGAFLVCLCVGWVSAGATAALMLQREPNLTSVADWVQRPVLWAIAWTGLLPIFFVVLFVLGGGWNN